MAQEQIFPFEMAIGSFADVAAPHEFAGYCIKREAERRWVQLTGKPDIEGEMRDWSDLGSAFLVIPKTKKPPRP
jgi:hypothetical protein